MVTPQPTSLLPSPTLQITRFLQFVKNVYADLPKTMVSHSLFWGAEFTTCVSDVATAVAFIFSQTSLFEPGEGEIPEDTSKGSSVSVECWYHLFSFSIWLISGQVFMFLSCHALLQSMLPKAAISLKVLAELPIIVVLMYQVRYHIPYMVFQLHPCAVAS